LDIAIATKASHLLESRSFNGELLSMPTVNCTEKLDIVLLIDHSTSAEIQFETQREAAMMLVNSFNDARFAIITYSGPPTWSEYYQCKERLATYLDCGIKIQQTFKDEQINEEILAGLEGKKGTTMTS